MAGMLPGVEAARRRRFHQKSNQYHGVDPSPAASGYGGASSTRRSSFCLYVSNHDFNLCSSTFSTRSQILCDESRLGAEVTEAKKRLDERLQAQWRSETTRSKGRASSEVEKVKKSGSKRLNWLKMRWRSPEEECVVCLEPIMVVVSPETLTQLQCGHRFHTQCLLPWLQANAHCPCCRMEIPFSS